VRYVGARFEVLDETVLIATSVKFRPEFFYHPNLVIRTMCLIFFDEKSLKTFPEMLLFRAIRD